MPKSAKDSKGSKGGFKAKLRGRADAWEQAKNAKGLGFPGPDGVYPFQLVAAEVRDSTATKEWLHAVLTFEARKGKFTGEKLSSRYDLEDPERMVWLIRDLAKLGVETDDLELENLEETLKELQDNEPFIVGSVKTSGDWQNIRLLRVIEEDEVDDVELPDDADGEPEEEKSSKSSKSKEDSGEEEETPELEVGSRVVVDFDGKDFGGEIIKIKGDQAKVRFDDDDEQMIDLSDCRPEEADDEEEKTNKKVSKKTSKKTEEEEDAEIEVGSRVTFKVGGKTKFGVVKKIKGDDFNVKMDKTGDLISCERDELTLAETADD